MLLLMMIQAAAQAPDIELEARARIREVRIERSGEAALEVRGGPGSDVRIESPAANGRTKLRNVSVEVRAEARVADPTQNPPEPATPQPE